MAVGCAMRVCAACDVSLLRLFLLLVPLLFLSRTHSHFSLSLFLFVVG